MRAPRNTPGRSYVIKDGRKLHLARGDAAGVCGMVIVAGLVTAQGLLMRTHGTGLSGLWVFALTLPGMLGAHTGYKQGQADGAIGRGIRAGVITAHLAAPLLVAMLVLGAATTDWGAYAAQVGPEVAGAVQSASVPATVLVSAIAVVVAYAGCALLALMGALVYSAARNVVK